MQTKSTTQSATRVMVIAAVILALLHQDFWFWNDKTLVFGFMPIGLFYHACYSLVAGLFWAIWCKVAWPAHLEAWADEFDEPKATSTRNQEGGH